MLRFSGHEVGAATTVVAIFRFPRRAKNVVADAVQTISVRRKDHNWKNCESFCSRQFNGVAGMVSIGVPALRSVISIGQTSLLWNVGSVKRFMGRRTSQRVLGATDQVSIL
jgi:hypothetical protein